MKRLQDLIRFADISVEKIFDVNGTVLPMYHAIDNKGQHLIFAHPQGDKDVAASLIRVEFALRNVETYVFVCEAWMLDSGMDAVDIDLAKIVREGLADHPDRREVVAYSAETLGMMQTAHRFILRPEHGPPKLSPLHMNKMDGVVSEGRMVGMLTARKK